MAHSIQEFGGQFLVLNDLDIVAAVTLLKRIADDEADEFLKELALRWEQALRVAGPGTIDLELDALGRSDSDRRRLCEGLATLRQRAASFGDTVPGSVLGVCSFKGATLTDYPSHLVRTLALALEELLSCRRDGDHDADQG